MCTSQRTSREGFGLVEVMVAMTVLAIALLGLVQTILGAQMVARSTRDSSIANAAMLRAVEDFYGACKVDFDAALTAYRDGTVTPTAPPALGKGATITLTLLLDEPAIRPPIDLNNDGDFLDNAVAPANARAGVLRINVVWSGVLGRQELECATIVARGEVQ